MTIHDDLFARARAVMPGGVSSPVRAFGAVGGTPRFVASARGATITDVAGRKYVDFVGAWGPMIVGHAHPEVVAAVQNAVADSPSFGAPSLPELLLAEEIVARVAPVERVRFTSSGTEAVMTAIRLARGITGRRLVVKFAGCYHGHGDPFLVAAGSGVATLGLPDSPGVTTAAWNWWRRCSPPAARTSPPWSPRRSRRTWASSCRRRASTPPWPGSAASTAPSSSWTRS